MTPIKAIALLACTVSLSACSDLSDGVMFGHDKGDKTVDRGIDAKDLSQLKAGIWIDPNGCDHWIIDDGAEGYLSQRLDPYGKPVCSGVAEPNTAIGPFKKGSAIEDPI